MEVFSALVTHFVDDYKLRGMHPSRNIGPQVFATKEEAKQWVAKCLYYYFEDDAEWTESDIAQVPSLAVEDFHYDEKYKTYSPMEDRMGDYDYMTTIASAMNEGEFVPRTVTWEVTKHEVPFPPLPPKGEPIRKKLKK